MHTLPPLTRSLLQGDFALPKNVACGSLQKFPEKVLQFGEGNFLRGFFDWMLDETNARGLFGGSVVAVQPIPAGMAPQINQQDGPAHLAEEIPLHCAGLNVIWMAEINGFREIAIFKDGVTL